MSPTFDTVDVAAIIRQRLSDHLQWEEQNAFLNGTRSLPPQRPSTGAVIDLEPSEWRSLDDVGELAESTRR